MTACSRTSPVSMYRLVNVPVNPSGRCGAPETEPGPSGMGRPADDELMEIPFQQVVPPHDRAPGGWVAPVTPWPLPWPVPGLRWSADGGCVASGFGIRAIQRDGLGADRPGRRRSRGARAPAHRD